jgi:hypothetical protein
VLREPGERVIGLVLIVQSVHRDHIRLRQLKQQRMLDAAGHAP